MHYACLPQSNRNGWVPANEWRCVRVCKGNGEREPIILHAFYIVVFDGQYVMRQIEHDAAHTIHFWHSSFTTYLACNQLENGKRSLRRLNLIHICCLLPFLILRKTRIYHSWSKWPIMCCSINKWIRQMDATEIATSSSSASSTLRPIYILFQFKVWVKRTHHEYFTERPIVFSDGF